MLSIDATIGLDSSDRSTNGFGSIGEDHPSDGGALDQKDEESLDDLFMRLATSAESQGSTYFQTAVRPYWSRNYRAFRSQHFMDSKYHSKQFKGRSKLFRPKTRDAVRKKMQSTAQALFSTGDVVSIVAENEADDTQSAAAALKQQIINYRLSRESRRNGVRWFFKVMGACQTANIAGICASKQYWKYKEDKDAKPTTYPASVDPVTGQPTPAMTDESPKTIEDRPEIEDLPPEQVIFDVNCDWTNIAQSTQFIRIARPMSPDDAFDFISSSKGDDKKIPFYEKITISDLKGAETSSGPSDTIASRTARNDGRDPMQLMSGNFGRVWLYEWYIRWEGRDYTFWTLKNQMMLSRPVFVEDAYPEQHGERPIVIGYGALEAFRTTPTSPVESWQPLQQELNDQVNLRLDHLKQTVAPPTKVKRGTQVDLEAVQKRGADRVIMVNDMADVETMQFPDIPMGAANQDAQLSADFDSLVGIMNMGTVQTNRQLNETVGGMSLLSGDAASMSEFDLTVFVESWVDPVINQLLRLEETYESDENILAICGERARLWQKFGISEITDHLLLAETTISVKVGTGSSTLPMQRLQKFALAAKTTMDTLQPFVQAQVIKPPVPRVKEIIETIFGAAGFKDGGDRFFMQLSDDMSAPPQQDPKAAGMAADADAKKAQIQADLHKHDQDIALKQQELAQKDREMQFKAAIDSDKNRSQLMVTLAKTQAEVQRAQLANAHDRGKQAAQHVHDASTKAADRQAQQMQAASTQLGSMFGLSGQDSGFPAQLPPPQAQQQLPPSSGI